MFLFFFVICRVRAQLCIDQYLRTLSFLTLIHFIRLRKCSSDSVHVHGPTALTVNVLKRSFSVASGQNKSETCTIVLWQPISLSTCLAASLFFHYGAYAKAFFSDGLLPQVDCLHFRSVVLPNFLYKSPFNSKRHLMRASV